MSRSNGKKQWLSRNGKEVKKIVMTFKVTASMHADIEALADKEMTGSSTILRRAVAKYLEEKNNGK